MVYPRFIGEFANYQRREIAINDLMQPDIKTEALNHIDGTLKAYKKGLITVSETMNMLVNWPDFCDSVKNEN